MTERIVQLQKMPAAAASGAARAEVSGDTPEERVIAAIRQVYDPEIPVNLYDLGLIYAIDIDAASRACIQMTLTTPACPVAGSLPGKVREAVVALDEFSEVCVELVWDPPWSQDMMTDEARLELGML